MCLPQHTRFATDIWLGLHAFMALLVFFWMRCAKIQAGNWSWRCYLVWNEKVMNNMVEFNGYTMIVAIIKTTTMVDYGDNSMVIMLCFLWYWCLCYNIVGIDGDRVKRVSWKQQMKLCVSQLTSPKVMNNNQLWYGQCLLMIFCQESYVYNLLSQSSFHALSIPKHLSVGECVCQVCI